MSDAGAADIVDVEINRLAQMGYDVPNMQRRKRNIPGEKRPVAATAEEYSTFNEYNRKAADALRRFMTQPSWSKMSPEAQSQIIMGIYRKYSRHSSNIVRREMANRN